MHYPKILSWLSSRAGVDEARGRAVWDEIIEQARLRYPETDIGSPAYWDDIVTELHRRMAIEASHNGRQAWQVQLNEVSQFTALLDLQTSMLTRLMLGWRDITLAATRQKPNGHQQDLAA